MAMHIKIRQEEDLTPGAKQNVRTILDIVGDFHVAVVTCKDPNPKSKATSKFNVVDTGATLLLPGDSRVQGDKPVVFGFQPANVGIGNLLSFNDAHQGQVTRTLPIDQIVKIEKGPAYATPEGVLL